MSELQNLIYRRSEWASHYAESSLRHHYFKTVARCCATIVLAYAIFRWRADLMRVVDVLLPALNL